MCEIKSTILQKGTRRGLLRGVSQHGNAQITSPFTHLFRNSREGFVQYAVDEIWTSVFDAIFIF